MKKKPEKKCFIVLGMHRSATSLTAKALATQIYMGEKFLPPHPTNPHGFYEDQDIIKLNNKILQMAGGLWYKPPSEEAILAVRPRIEEQIKALMEKKFSDKHFYGWKDPRTTLTIKLFMPYLHNPHFIACFRDPLKTAKSLATREHSFSLPQCLELTKVYNQRMLKFLSEYSGSGEFTAL